MDLIETAVDTVQGWYDKLYEALRQKENLTEKIQDLMDKITNKRTVIDDFGRDSGTMLSQLSEETERLRSGSYTYSHSRALARAARDIAQGSLRVMDELDRDAAGLKSKCGIELEKDEESKRDFDDQLSGIESYIVRIRDKISELTGGLL